MKQLKEMPEEGQFVAMWIIGGQLWSGTFRYDGGQLFEYNVDDCWEECDEYFKGDSFLGCTYFVKD